MANFEPLKLVGGVILIKGRVEAFAIGELINEKTAVVHIEKANPEIPGIYAVLNQQFCENQWRDVPYVSAAGKPLSQKKLANLADFHYS